MLIVVGLMIVDAHGSEHHPVPAQQAVEHSHARPALSRPELLALKPPAWFPHSDSHSATPPWCEHVPLRDAVWTIVQRLVTDDELNDRPHGLDRTPGLPSSAPLCALVTRVEVNPLYPGVPAP